MAISESVMVISLCSLAALVLTWLIAILVRRRRAARARQEASEQLILRQRQQADAAAEAEIWLEIQQNIDAMNRRFDSRRRN